MSTDNSNGARIDVASLTKAYGSSGTNAVDSIDLVIESGEFMTLLGPSGSGKTTTLNMIAGFEDVTSGRILLDGADIAAVPPYRRNLGMVFQNYALFPHMTAAENVAYPLKQRRVRRPEIADRVREALDLVRLGEHADRLPSQLSGGQQQRVALARAVVFRPRALLLDEPLGALDKNLRESLQLEISRLHRELGITFIFVTHDQEEALALSDRIAVFRDGHIEQVGTPEELYARPESHFVATFLGDSNVFFGTARDGVLHSAVAPIPLAAGSDAQGRVALIIRPEQMRFDPEAGDGCHVLEATVTDVVYQGAFRRVFVEFSDGTPGQVRQPASTDIALRPGDRARVGWPAERAVVVPHPDESAAAG